MNWHNLIFSSKPIFKWSRHLLFWLLWWLYFVGTFYFYQFPQQPLVTSFTWTLVLLSKSFLILVVHLTACYASLFLVSDFLSQSRWSNLVTGLIAMGGVSLGLGYFIYALIFPFIDEIFQIEPIASKDILFWASLNAGLLSATKVAAAAVVIKLTKRWWFKEKEKEILEKEKVLTELQSLKAQIHPALLFNTLDHIYSLARNDSAKAPEILLRLSDLLSYMLYECDQPLVPLEKEISMMQNYIALEQITHGEQLEFEIQIKGDASLKKIPPFLLLPFIEHSFQHCSSTEENAWIRLELKIRDHSLSMKLINGLSPSASTEGLIRVKRRLALLFQDNYSLKQSTTEEIFMISLEVPINALSSTPERLQAINV